MVKHQIFLPCATFSSASRRVRAQINLGLGILRPLMRLIWKQVRVAALAIRHRPFSKALYQQSDTHQHR